MAALTATAVGTSFTPAAAAGGGDTAPGGSGFGGYEANFLVAVVGATATTITVDGTAYGPITSQTVLIPLRRYNGSPVNITYSQVTGVTVAAVRALSTPYVSYGT